MSTASLQTSEKVSALREQRRKMTDRIDAKIAQARDAQAKRKQDLQLKIVVGAAAMKLAEQGKISWDDLSAVISAKDRMKFHIPNAATLAAINSTSEPTTIEKIMATIEEARRKAT